MSAPTSTTPANTAANPISMSLLEIQRAMSAAVMMPLTANEDMQTVAPDGRDMHATAEAFIAPNNRLTAFERLELYNRQYWYRLLDALSDDFPAIARSSWGPALRELCRSRTSRFIQAVHFRCAILARALSSG